MNVVKVATTQFDLRPLPSADDFWQRIAGLCESAAAQGARLFILPEYFSLSWLVRLADGDFWKALRLFPEVKGQFESRFLNLAERLNMVIVAGTVPDAWGEDWINRSYIYFPDGSQLYQDKQNMTRCESENWNIVPGDPQISTFELAGAKMGLAICYDVEFPHYVQKLVSREVDVILSPSCTGNIHGHWRVRLCAQARAVETQSYVITSAIVGGDSSQPQYSSHYGQSGFFTPCDVQFPNAGILMLGDVNCENVHVAELDLARLHEVRNSGTVLNRRDLMRGQTTAGTPRTRSLQASLWE